MNAVRRSILSCSLIFMSLCGAVEPLRAQAININQADAAALDQALVGVGAEKAKAIVAFRQQHGPFKSVDELALVKGIGPKLIERNRANIRVDAGRPTSPPAKGAVVPKPTSNSGKPPR
ncbi:MAG: helix-hairpin-helix domain-containing protein [Steroidobacteraceae bacterium]|nr:helix-hairpin-helix domain-containing protein [Steroidobacteraceae bacterium]